MTIVPIYCPKCQTIVATVNSIEANKKEVTPETLAMHVNVIDWDNRRIDYALRDLKIETIADLVQKHAVEFLRVPNFGRTSLSRIEQVLAEMNLHLGMELK